MPGSHQVYFTITPAEDPNAELDQRNKKDRGVHEAEEDIERYKL